MNQGVCLSIFFQRNKSLLNYLRRVICRDELRLCKYELLQFLGRFIDAAERQVVPYAAEIKDTCVAVFNAEKYSDVRCSTFPILRRIVEVTSGNVDVASQMNLPQLVDDFLTSLGNTSKLSSSSNSFVYDLHSNSISYFYIFFKLDFLKNSAIILVLTFVT